MAERQLYTAMRKNNPFDEMERMLEQMFSQGTGGFGMDVDIGMSDIAVDVAEKEDEVVVTADVPGYEKDDIELLIDSGVFTIRAERDTERNEQESGHFVHRERRVQSASRRVELPAEVVEEDATAEYSNGVLTVVFPKQFTDESDQTRIDIE